VQILQPPEWVKPKGYSNGIVAKGRTVYLAGQFGCNAEGKFDTSDFAGQARQSLKNIVAILAEAGAGPEHICRLNWYVADRKEYIASLRDVGAAYRDIIGKHFPVMTALEVGGFMDDGARLEIEVTAMIPE
jgi:enamine deaminase RidA (YjgF/YER057c/UK114 family)